MPKQTRLTTNERLIAAIDRFSAAVHGKDQDELQAATGDLLEVFANTAQRLVTQATAFIIEQQEKERKQIEALISRLELLQRHIEQIDRILDEQARARAVGE